MAKVRKKYDITAREGVKFCAAAIFFLLPQALFRGWRLFVGWLVALLVGPVMELLVELLVALLVGLACGTGYGRGRLPLPVASLFGGEKLRFGCGNLGLRAVF